MLLQPVGEQAGSRRAGARGRAGGEPSPSGRNPPLRTAPPPRWMKANAAGAAYRRLTQGSRVVRVGEGGRGEHSVARKGSHAFLRTGGSMQLCARNGPALALKPEHAPDVPLHPVPALPSDLW